MQGLLEISEQVSEVADQRYQDEAQKHNENSSRELRSIAWFIHVLSPTAT